MKNKEVSLAVLEGKKEKDDTLFMDNSLVKISTDVTDQQLTAQSGFMSMALWRSPLEIWRVQITTLRLYEKMKALKAA